MEHENDEEESGLEKDSKTRLLELEEVYRSNGTSIK
jgi:hypothetical protein